VPSPDVPALIPTLPARVAGLRAALLLEPASGRLLARAPREGAGDWTLLAARASRLWEAAGRGGASVKEVALQAEGAALVLLGLPAGALCLLLHPEAFPARAAFEARRALRGAA